MLQSILQIIILGVFPAIMAFAAASDLVSMTIANRLQLLLIISFAIVAIGGGLPIVLISYHLLAFALVLAGSFFCFARGWIGGGDAKLAACTALWFGFTPQLYSYLLVAACLGGALTVIVILLRAQTLPAVLVRQNWIARLHDNKQGVPYGIALAGAALMTYPQSSIFALALGY